MIATLFAHTVRKNPEQIAVVDGGKRITYQELYAQGQAFVRYLAHKLKIRRDERIAVLLPNCVEFILGFFAVAEVGAVFMPLNIHLTERELQYYVEKCGITAVITNSQLYSRWSKIAGEIQKGRIVIADRLDTAKKRDSDSACETRDLDGLKKTDPDTEVLFLSTSGSTGTPKIVPRTQSNLLAGAKNVSEALGVTEEDRFLSVIPFYHANGFSNCMFLPMMSGATIVLMGQFSAKKVVHVIREENITILFGSPFIFSVISEIAGEGYSFPSMRTCLSSGAPMSEDLAKTFFTKFGANVRQLYGSSETGTVSIQLGDLPEQDGAVGRPLKGIDVKIVSKDSKELPANQAGEIIVKSPAMTKGYAAEPELNRRVFYRGYFRTGDLGMLDGHGNLHISGRKDRVINAGGVKVDPLEIEDVLVSFHKVREAVVLGVKNRRGTEIIKAILVAQPDCKLSEVIGYCRGRLAEYKIPRIVDFRDDIPRDIMGKVVRT